MPTACSSGTPTPAFSYAPNARFSFPRSYIYKWRTGLFTWNASFSDNVILFTHQTLANYFAHIVMKPEVWAWSSNNYTLDHVICEAWYDFNGSHFGMNCKVEWKADVTSHLPYLYVHATDTPEGDYAESLLPAAPGDYWLPDPE